MSVARFDSLRRQIVREQTVLPREVPFLNVAQRRVQEKLVHALNRNHGNHNRERKKRKGSESPLQPSYLRVVRKLRLLKLLTHKHASARRDLLSFDCDIALAFERCLGSHRRFADRACHQPRDADVEHKWDGGKPDEVLDPKLDLVSHLKIFAVGGFWIISNFPHLINGRPVPGLIFQQVRLRIQEVEHDKFEGVEELEKYVAGLEVFFCQGRRARESNYADVRGGALLGAAGAHENCQRGSCERSSHTHRTRKSRKRSRLDICGTNRSRPRALSVTTSAARALSGSHVMMSMKKYNTPQPLGCQSNTVRPSTLFKQNCEF